MKGKNAYLLLLSILLITVFAVPSQADYSFLSEYTQTLYNSESGLEANEANDVLQTSDGYIWIATYSGLKRFDGMKFRRYDGKDDDDAGFTAQSATFLYEDSRKTLWVCTNDAGLFKYEKRQFTQLKDLTKGAFGTVRSLAEDTKGNIYFGTSNGAGVVTPEGMKRISLGRFDSSFILSMTGDKEGRIWCATRTGELLIIKDGVLEKALSAQELKGLSVMSLLTLRSGELLAGCAEGEVLSITMKNGEPQLKTIAELQISTINGLYEDKIGRVWLCADNGFGWLDSKRAFRRIDGALAEGSLETIIEDYEGQFWLTSSRHGLLHLSRNKFRDINFASGIPNEVVNTADVVKGEIWIGTDEGLYIAGADGRLKSTPLTKALAKKRIRCVMNDRAGNVWVSSYSTSGLIKVGADGKIKSFTEKNGLPNNKIRFTYECGNGQILVGTNGGAALISGDKVIKAFDDTSGMRSLTVLAAAEDSTGNLYLATDGAGIYVINRELVIDNITKAEGLASDVVLRLSYDKELRGMWVSSGNSLCWLNSDGKAKTVKVTAPVASGIFDIKAMDKDRVMLIADTGIHIGSKKALLSGQPVRWLSLTRRDGLHSTVTANSWNGLDEKTNTYYLCTAKGLYAINSELIKRSVVKPKIAINSVTADDVLYENPTELELPSDARRIKLDLAVLSFQNPDYNTGTYFLKGFDSEPVTTEARELGNISYTNLRGGSYTLEFAAENSDGVKSAPTIRLGITKKKAFYEEPLVVLLLLIGAGALIFLLTRQYYSRHAEELQKRQEELRSVMAQAFSAIAGTIDAKDRYTRGHSSRVAEYSVALGKKLGLSKTELDNLYYTALLHDIGKVGVPDEILNKNGPLSDEEYAIMKKHPTMGGKILRNITMIGEIQEGALYHHERYDGKGYNGGLKGKEIPYVARIIGIADSLDAMATRRTYKNAMDLNYIISEIEKNKGFQFDPEMAAIMVKMLRSGELQLSPVDRAGTLQKKPENTSEPKSDK